MHPRDILKSTPFFADVLTDDEIDMLAARAHFIAFAQGAAPMEEDAPGTSMFVIAKGKVGVTVAEDAAPLATLGPGDMSLLTGARRSATVTALEPVEVLEVNKDALAHVLSPTLVGRFVDMLIRRQRMLDRIAGGSAWGLVRPSRDELAALIAKFFAARGS